MAYDKKQWERVRGEEWARIRRICMDDLARLHANMKDGQVADRIGMARPTYNRIKNDENHIPTPDNIVRLLKGSENEELATDAVALLNGELGKMLKDMETLPSSPLDKKIIEDYRLKNILSNKNNFIAYELASIKGGTSEDRLLRVLGTGGIKAMDLLAREGIVQKKGDGRFHVREYGLLHRDLDELADQARIYGKLYDPSMADEDGNYLYTFSDGLNKKALRMVKDEFCRHYANLKSIFRNDDNRGTYPAYAVGFTDALDREQ